MLRFVHLEDDPHDVELVHGMLIADGIECHVAAVSSRDAFVAALSPPPDLILADASLPGFDGRHAQRIAASACPQVPFVYVSGTMGEEIAIERLKEGATDYVLKQRLGRLPAAVRRALDEAENRARRVRAEDEQRDLQRASRAKNEFLSRMSHDLRTPLNAIIGFAQILELERLTPEQGDSVAQILRGGRHLLDLINEVLDITRIEAGYLSISLEPVDVGGLIREVLDLVRPLAVPREISLEMSPRCAASIFATADHQRLRQVVLNLLSNAVKYNRHGGSVMIDCVSIGRRVRVSVRDTGAGIPPNKLQLLFTPFERLGAERTGVEGTGLGLVLARGLTEAMGGTLGVDSVLDEGSVFWLELPQSDGLARVPEPPPQPRAAAAAATHVAGVLLYIEDNSSNAMLLRRLLKYRPGIRLVHATDGEMGLQLLRSERPGLVLLDMHLPDMSGEEVLRRIHADPVTRELAVAVLSADATAGQQRRMIASGAAAYITKPFDIGRLLELIDKVLRVPPPGVSA